MFRAEQSKSRKVPRPQKGFEAMKQTSISIFKTARACPRPGNIA